MEIKQKPCDPRNYRAYRRSDIKYIVIHYTANDGDTDEGNGNYFANNDTGDTSAHYFVDEDSATQSVPDEACAFHCGGTSYRHPECRNDNAIGIEMCSDKDDEGNYYISDDTVRNTIELTKRKMTEHDIDIDHVLRHYDVTGKKCPAPWVEDEELWFDFKERLDEEREDDDMQTRFERLSDIPNEYGFQDIIEKLMDAKIINGDGSDKSGNNDVIDLSLDMVRILIFNYRAGIYDEALVAEGLDPARNE